MGPTSLQIKALHEVYTAAVRAELPDAAIRHACCMIQVCKQKFSIRIGLTDKFGVGGRRLFELLVLFENQMPPH